MDTKLKLKPIELIDIGIDKLTKIPVPILNDNMVSTFDNDNGVPVDSFTIVFDSHFGDFSATLYSNYQIDLSLDYGDGNTQDFVLSSGTSTSIIHNYTSAATYTITATGWLDKITSLIILPYNYSIGGTNTVSINNMKNLSYLDLTGNYLTQINLDGMISLNTIKLIDNYFSNDEIDDIYNVADTFLTFGGYINTTGDNNGKPSVYSNIARTSLISKGWTLNYNT